jgi:hypothetical protein
MPQRPEAPTVTAPDRTLSRAGLRAATRRPGQQLRAAGPGPGSGAMD